MMRAISSRGRSNHTVFSPSPRLQRGCVFPPDLVHFYTPLAWGSSFHFLKQEALACLTWGLATGAQKPPQVGDTACQPQLLAGELRTAA